MKLFKQKNGFTLIELVVVVTIIGILAVTSQTVYMASKMRSRDAVRQMHMLAMKSAVEQLFVVSGQYPEPIALKASLFETMPNELPADPKNGEADDGTQFKYVYGAAYDSESYLPGQKYEISANIEYGKKKEEKFVEKTDQGNDEARWELGNTPGSVNTDLPSTGDQCNSENEYAPGDAGSGNCVVVDEL